MVLIVLALSLLGSPAPASGEPPPLWTLPGAALLLWGVTTPGAAPRLLLHPYSLRLGRWSFPLYISHTIGVLTLGSFAYGNTATLGALLQLMAAFAAIWAFASPVLHWEAWYLPRLNIQIRRLLRQKLNFPLKRDSQPIDKKHI